MKRPSAKIVKPMDSKHSSNRIDNKVYNMAANLFGIQKEQQSDQFVILSSTVTNEPNKIMAVYSAIIEKAFALTLDNYRLHVATYNFVAREENEQIAKYNVQVDKFRKDHPLDKLQTTAANFFQLKHGGEYSKNYNDQVELYNQQYGMIIRKKRIQTIKPVTEQVFTNFLYLYNGQLMKRNAEYMRLRITTPRPVQEFKVNPHQVKSLKRTNGAASLDLCKKTIRSHRERMQEAGILVEYHFAGANRPVEVHINPGILVVLDLKTSKIVTAENQHVTLASGKVLPDNNANTRTIINECEIKANVENNSPDKEFPSVTPKPFVFYGNTSSKEQNAPLPPPPAGVKISETLPHLATSSGKFARTVTAGQVINQVFQSANTDENDYTGSDSPKNKSQMFRTLLIHPQQLAEELASGMHDNYRSIPLRELQSEAFRGTLVNEEFRQLVLYDFFKASAKFWRDCAPDKKPFVGVWKKAINLYLEHKFMAFTGGAFNKSVIVDDIEQLRWRLEHVRKYRIRNPNWQMLFPSDYFDFRREHNKEGGFEFTKKAWAKHKKYRDGAEARKRRAEVQSELRTKHINYAKKCETQIRKFYKNQMSMPELLHYVEHNLPSQFMQELPGMIEKIGVKFNSK